MKSDGATVAMDYRKKTGNPEKKQFGGLATRFLHGKSDLVKRSKFIARAFGTNANIYIYVICIYIFQYI